MLIRICGHFVNNPSHIDKLICIKGLPDEWFFRESRFGGKELIKPWEPDIEANIPASIKHLCEPFEITVVFPPIEKGGQYIVDKKTISALRFDYMTEQGQTMWEKIERYMDRMTPRDERIPVPVIVAPDQKSAFNPHEARRNPRGSLELRPAEVPVVDLNRNVSLVLEEPVRTVSVNPVKIEAEIVPQGTKESAPVEPIKTIEPLRCDRPGCNKVYDKKAAMRMHKMKAHKPAPQPAGV